MASFSSWNGVKHSGNPTILRDVLLVKMKLWCFRPAGAKPAAVETPFAPDTTGAFTVSMSEIKLASNENDAACPAG